MVLENPLQLWWLWDGGGGKDMLWVVTRVDNTNALVLWSMIQLIATCANLQKSAGFQKPKTAKSSGAGGHCQSPLRLFPLGFTVRKVASIFEKYFFLLSQS